MQSSQNDGVQIAMTFPMDNVKSKLMQEQSINETMIDDAIAEYRKFMSLFAFGNEKLPMISPEVDEVWHTHILFTRDYHRFCNGVAGRYLHHQPNIDSDGNKVEGVPASMFVHEYEKVYGKLPDIWKRNQFDCDGTPACNVSQCACNSEPTCSN